MSSHRKPHPVRVCSRTKDTLTRLCEHYAVDQDCIADAAIQLLALVAFPRPGAPQPLIRKVRRSASSPIAIADVVKGWISNAHE